MLRASDENEVVGSEEVRGAETTHFRARVDLRKLVKQLPATERPEDDVVQLLGSVPVEIWIDDESRLRRITIDEREPEKDTNPVATTTTVELFDYGVEVEVEPPPSDELISQEEFDRLTGSSIAPEASGKGELVSPEEVCESVRQQLPKKEADRLCSELKGNP